MFVERIQLVITDELAKHLKRHITTTSRKWWVPGSNPFKAVILTLVELLLSMQSVVQQESRRLCCLGAKPV